MAVRKPTRVQDPEGVRRNILEIATKEFVRHGYSGALVALGLAVVPTSLAFALWPGMRAR